MESVWRRKKKMMSVFLIMLEVCILGSTFTCINANTDPTDAAALQEMYSFLNQPSQLTQWSGSGSGGDPCGQSWKGITCSGSRVTEIKLPGLSLSGSVGYKLQGMSSVINLDLSNNNLGGQLPYQVPPNVQRLNLANNNFNGQIPWSISQLTSLKFLNLGHNQLQGALNDMFGQLSSLTTLDVSFNQLSGNLPQSMSSLSSVTTMYLQNNQFTGDINVLANLPLENLNVANNQFTGWIPAQLKNINLQKDGNSWSSGSAPPPPPGTPPPTKPNHNKNSGSGNSASNGSSDSGSKKSGIGGGGVAGIVISILLVGAVVAFFVMKRRSRRRPALDVEKLDNQPFAPLASSEVQGDLSAPNS